MGVSLGNAEGARDGIDEGDSDGASDGSAEGVAEGSTLRKRLSTKKMQRSHIELGDHPVKGK